MFPTREQQNQAMTGLYKSLGIGSNNMANAGTPNAVTHVTSAVANAVTSPVSQTANASIPTAGISSLPTPALTAPTVPTTDNYNAIPKTITDINNQQAGITSVQSAANPLIPPTAPPDVQSKITSLIGDITKYTTDAKPEANQDTYVQRYKDLLTSSGINQDRAKLVDYANIINGTEKDIQNEITKAGGVASPSLVQSLVQDRNKNLINRYDSLVKAVAAKNDYVDNLMKYEGLDRTAAENKAEKAFNAKKDTVNLLLDMQKTGYAQSKDFAEAIGKRQDRARDTIDMLLKYGGLSTVQDSEINQLALDSNIPVDLLKKSITSVAAQKQVDAMIKQQQLQSPKVQAIANQFDNEQAVKQYQTIAEQIDAVKNAGDSPTDDIQRIYSLAKVLDPNSAVKEGEYKTIQEYAQALYERYAKGVQRVFDNAGFLTKEARQFMQDTLNNRLKSSQKAFDNIRSEYGRRINEITGSEDGIKYITDYSKAFVTPDIKTEAEKAGYKVD